MRTTKTLLPILMFAMSTLLFACGSSGLSGTYVGHDSLLGEEQYEFISSKKVEYMARGISAKLDYKKEENTVSMSHEGRSMKFTIDDDGCLVGGFFNNKYCKK